MKTLVLNGSPKINGDTAALIRELVMHVNGEVRIISCYDNINPCADCRYCWEHAGCTLNDGMQEIYPFLEDCDNVIIASPIWFSSLSGPLLNLASRVHTYFAGSFFRRERMVMKVKKGVIILVGAEPGTEVIPAQTALTIMKFMNVDRTNISRIYSLDTNNLPARQDEKTLSECRRVAEVLNGPQEWKYRISIYIHGIRKELDIRFEKAMECDSETFVNVQNKAFYDDFTKYGTCPGYGRSAESLAEAMRVNLTYKIIADSQIIGKISVNPQKEGEYHLGCLCVVPAYQNIGIGKLAVGFLEKQLQDTGRIILETPEDNDRNIHFYEKCGYSIVGRTNEDGIKLAVLSKML